MLGSKKERKRRRKYWGRYWQGWMHPSNRTLRRMLKQSDIEIPDGGSYRKIGTWFEWN